MNLPRDYSVRPPTLTDAGIVTNLVNAAESVDLGEVMLELSDVETDWSSPALDLEHDSILVFDEKRDLVAIAQVSEERADIDVHPDSRGIGLGTSLIGWSERRAREQAVAAGVPARVGQTIPSDLEGAVEMLKSRGYEKLWDSWVLRLADGIDLSSARPDGVEIRPYRPDEEHAAYTVIDDAFSEWEGREPRSFEDWQTQVTKRKDFDPTLLVIATCEGELVGAAFGVNYPDEGWVDKVAVTSEFRGRGIGTALLATLFTEFRRRGKTSLRLNTDSRTGALDLYLNLGMSVEHSFTRWSLLLD